MTQTEINEKMILCEEYGRMYRNRIFNHFIRIVKTAPKGASVAANDIGAVAGKYKNGECDKAAAATKAMLLEKKKKGEVITLTWTPNSGYVWSDSKNMAVGNNGFHMGVLYEGNVYCNIHPYGMPEAQWIADFNAPGVKNPPIRVPF